MPNNITDVSTFTNPIQTVANGDSADAADFALAPQGLANRTRYLNDNGLIRDVNGHVSTSASAGNNTAITATGHGTSSGVQSTGGASNGAGVTAQGGATNGAGVVATGAGTGDGVTANGGSGGGAGVTATGGAGNAGLSGTGGTNGTGVVGHGTGNARGGSFFGAGTGDGLSAVGGASNTSGVNATGGGTGAGVTANGGAGGGHAVVATGSGNGSGIVAGGSGSGDGAYGYTNSATGIGVHADGGNAGLPFKAERPGGGFVAGQFVGDVNISGNCNIGGTLTKGAGAFKIDHPLDPENKFLVHSFVESPEAKNIYDGIAVTGDDCMVVVELPDWFEALNEEFRYQLTPIGGLHRVGVAQELSNGKFVIVTEGAGQKVSWQITGNRKDPFIKAQPIIVEQDKSEAERGKYLHPEAYGKTAAEGIQ